jgi:hypothetical protein
MQKWEYKVVPVAAWLGAKEAREALNTEGAEGWEMVTPFRSITKPNPKYPGAAAATSDDDLVLFILKRPKE